MSVSTELRQQYEKQHYQVNAHAFIFEALRTKDEHAASQGLEAIRRFPDELCLRATLDLYLVSGKLLIPASARYALATGIGLGFLAHIARSGIVFVEKSRHVLVTWLTCAYLLWRARAFPHQLLLVQSKREEDVAALVYDKEPDQGRISFLEWGLPDYLRTAKFPSAGKYCHLYLPNGSHIWGIPEGGHIIRSHNPSVVFSDEAAFQPEFDKAYTAALPAITHGGQLIVVSSAEPGMFQQLVEAEQ